MNKKTLEKIVSMYMKALGKEKLSEATWKRLAKVNKIVLGLKDNK